MSIAERLETIKSQTDGSSLIIAVSKKQSVETIREAYNAGLRNFAENYQQEGAEKQEQLSGLDIQWHFIGAIQSKKLKKIVGSYDLIHSVDRLKVVEEIDRIAVEMGLRQKILVQVNFAEEDSKAGLTVSELDSFFSSAAGLTGIEICGLMVMPPFVDNPEDNRDYFRQGRETLEDLRSRFDYLGKDSFKELSMGTSQDFVVAIQEGATMVRIGTQLLGGRA